MVIKKKPKDAQLKIFQRHLENERITAWLLSSLLRLCFSVTGLVSQSKNRAADRSFIQVSISKGCSGSVVKNITLFQQIMRLTHICWATRMGGIWWVLRTAFTPDHTVSPGEKLLLHQSMLMWFGLCLGYSYLYTCILAVSKTCYCRWASLKYPLAGGLSQALLLRSICCAHL